jgi:hypothetical protein
VCNYSSSVGCRVSSCPGHRGFRQHHGRCVFVPVVRSVGLSLAFLTWDGRMVRVVGLAGGERGGRQGGRGRPSAAGLARKA